MMATFKTFLLVLLVSLLSESVLCVDNCKQTDDEPTNAAFGYELLEERLDNLQFSFLELFVHVKELGELIVNNQRETNHLMRVLEGKLVSNVSLITSYSKLILENQVFCANHDEIKKELSKMKPKSASKRPSRPTSDSIAETSSGSSTINSCRETGSTTTGPYELSGVNGEEPFTVLCEMQQFEGGWLVFQHRFNGSVNFYRNWTEYKNGFGDVQGEFWLGLQRIHEITKEGTWELIVEMKDFQDNYKYARYAEFGVGSESEQYVLSKLGNYSGTAEDYLTYHKGSKFSTHDRDNDGSTGKCAQTCQGAWWYNSCYQSNLNGLYKNVQDSTAIKWLSTKPSLKYTKMMIRKT